MAEIPWGGIAFALTTALAVAPVRHPRALARWLWIPAVAPNALPAQFAAILALSTAPTLARPADADPFELGLTVATFVGLAVVARYGAVARPVLGDALQGAFGERVEGAALARPGPWRRRGLWWRVWLVPWPIRPISVERIADVVYGPDARAQRLDVYRHRSRPSPAPTLVYFHGGRFRWGRKSFEARPLLHRLARRGWTCISADYLLAPTPGEGFPRHLVDAKRAVAWARTEGRHFGVDPDRIVVAGSSAGAHLALMSALTAGEPALQPDFAHVDTSCAAVVGLYGYYGRVDDSGRPSSPLDHLGAAPPVLLVHGTHDPSTPLAGAIALTAGLEAEPGNRVVLAALPGAQHVFDLFHSIRFEAVVDAIEDFTVHVGVAPAVAD